jgi:hypothetical protein
MDKIEGGQGRRAVIAEGGLRRRVGLSDVRAGSRARALDGNVTRQLGSSESRRLNGSLNDGIDGNGSQACVMKTKRDRDGWVALGFRSSAAAEVGPNHQWENAAWYLVRLALRRKFACTSQPPKISASLHPLFPPTSQSISRGFNHRVLEHPRCFAFAAFQVTKLADKAIGFPFRRVELPSDDPLPTTIGAEFPFFRESPCGRSLGEGPSASRGWRA